MRMALAAMIAMLTLLNFGIRDCEADVGKTSDQSSNLARSYRCIGGDFVACLEEAGFACQAVSASPMKYLCALEGRPMFLVIESTDDGDRWEVQFAQYAPGELHEKPVPKPESQ